MTVHIRLRHQLLGGHRHVRVFVGADTDHLEKSGDLVFSDDERVNQWTPFLTLMRVGAHYSGKKYIVVDDIEEE